MQVVSCHVRFHMSGHAANRINIGSNALHLADIGMPAAMRCKYAYTLDRSNRLVVQF